MQCMRYIVAAAYSWTRRYVQHCSTALCVQLAKLTIVHALALADIGQSVSK